MRNYERPLTSKKMVVEAPSLHELIHEQAMFCFCTKSNQPNKVGMMNFTKKLYLRLHTTKWTYFKVSQKCANYSTKVSEE